MRLKLNYSDHLCVLMYFQEVCVHDYLAVRICGEMLKDPTAPEVRLYAKTLGNLELSRDETVRKDLQTLLQQLAEVITQKEYSHKAKL